MGNVITRSAAAGAIVRDLNLAFVAATTKGAPYADDASRHLKASIDLAVSLAAKRAANQDAVVTLRARQRVQDAKCNDLVGAQRDALYNQVGRPGNDVLFNQIFPAGVGGYTAAPPSRKHIALELLAGLLENSTHPLVPKETAVRIAAELRTEGAAMKAINDALLPAVAEAGLLQTQWTSGARQGQVQMARLKKYWRSTGMSESDIHAILPDRPVGTAPAAVVEGAATGTPAVAPAAPAAPTLTIVPPMVEELPEELPLEPAATDPAADQTLFMDEEVVAAK